MQGLGLYTLEELKFSPSGLLYTRGPSQYKIPAVCDVPLRFNVYLLPDSHNPHAIYSSKVRPRSELLIQEHERVLSRVGSSRIKFKTPRLVLLFFRASESPPSSWAALCSSPSKTPWRLPALSPGWSARFPWTAPRFQSGSAWPASRHSLRW